MIQFYILIFIERSVWKYINFYSFIYCYYSFYTIQLFILYILNKLLDLVAFFYHVGDATYVSVGSIYLCRLLCCDTFHSSDKFVIGTTIDTSAGTRQDLSRLDLFQQRLWKTWWTLSWIRTHVHCCNVVSFNRYKQNWMIFFESEWIYIYKLYI